MTAATSIPIHAVEPAIARLEIELPFGGPCVLAFGGDMKCAWCLTHEDRAFLSPALGDAGDIVALGALLDRSARLEELLGIRPQIMAHDLHPDSNAAREARSRALRDGLATSPVQHHHAHIAACMVDNGVPRHERVIGVCFDGTGYGTDGTIWGGEFLVCGYSDFRRASHLRFVPQPGGDAATRRPYRMALSWLRIAGLDWSDDLPPAVAAGPDERRVLDRQLAARVNTPMTSSMGRLFDAVASIVGLRHRVSREAQAAIELESIAAERAGFDDGAYDFGRLGSTIDPSPMVRDAVADVLRGENPSVIAARFHRGVARMVLDVCRRLRDETRMSTVALSGGVWQNSVLVGMTAPLLERDGFRVLTHRRVPTHDGGVALGQVAVTLACFDVPRVP